MEEWQLTSLILCAFGLLKELRPSEPFVTDYIINFKNVTSETVIHEIFPISTYTILGTLVVVFLITDFLRYRPIIIFQGFSYVVTWILLIWGQSLLSLQFVQIFYGIAVSADVGYYTYIYAKVRRENYKKVTSYTYTAALIGKFLSGTISQILISLNLMDYHELNYISLCSLSFAMIISISLPKVEKSIYFYRDQVQGMDEMTNGEIQSYLENPKVEVSPKSSSSSSTFLQRLRITYPILWSDFKKAYSNSYVVKWSIWWAIATAGNLQAQNYIQALWKVVAECSEDSGSTRYNGGVNAIQCLLSAILSFTVGHIHIRWNLWGEGFLCFISLLQGLVLFWMSQANFLVFAYIAYVIFRVLYQLVITIANAEVAQGISKDSCGLIFGINTFLALVIQTILTLVVTDVRGLALDERSQFLVYSGYFGTLGLSFFVVAVTSFFKLKFSKNQLKSEIPLDIEEEEKEKLNSLDVTLHQSPKSNSESDMA